MKDSTALFILLLPLGVGLVLAIIQLVAIFLNDGKFISIF